MTDSAAESTTWLPRPDPTVLTSAADRVIIEQARRELAALQAVIETRLDGDDEQRALIWLKINEWPEQLELRLERRRRENTAAMDALQAVIVQRLDGNDTAISLLAEKTDRLPASWEAAIAHLERLHDEKFAAIQQQFTERDTRGEQEKKAAKEALDAALLAQKESVSQQNDANTTAATKSEVSFTKQIDAALLLIATLEKSLTDRITELKERIDRGEGSASGSADTRTERRLDTGTMIGVLGAVLALIAIAVTIVIATRGH